MTARALANRCHAALRDSGHGRLFSILDSATSRGTARWDDVGVTIERVQAKLKRTCGRCGHGLGSHDRPDPERGVSHFPPQACHVKRGCACIVFIPADDFCKREVREAVLRSLAG